MTMRCQKAESKKPAIWGALKLTKKLRQCRSRQLRRHFMSGRKTVNDSGWKRALSSSSPDRVPAFSAQSSDIARLHPGLLGSHLRPFILKSVRAQESRHTHIHTQTFLAIHLQAGNAARLHLRTRYLFHSILRIVQGRARAYIARRRGAERSGHVESWQRLQITVPTHVRCRILSWRRRFHPTPLATAIRPIPADSTVAMRPIVTGVRWW